MSRFDYRDPGTDPDYCNPLAPEPDDDRDARLDRLLMVTQEAAFEDRLCGWCGRPLSTTWAEDYCSMFCAIDAYNEECGE